MKKMVSRMNGKPRCEIFPCKQRAEIAIGPINKRALCYNVCLEHARQIKDDLIKVFAEIDAAVAEPPQTEVPRPEPEIVMESYDAETIEEDIAPNDTGEIGSADATEPQKSEHLTEEPAPESQVSQDVYICKYCGATFKKPDELPQYRSHIMNCPSKPKKQK